MARPASLTDLRVGAVAHALGPYEWRRLTPPHMVSRRALAARDAPGTTDPVPVSRHDARIELRRVSDGDG
ncbi:hypothetical protein [Streptomyces sp. NPDC059566]|uniref:hypothetical protein n=1 Tax=Streptomyces sp. NPDC059566 TaxID=3346866 RepID=UPI00369CED23